MRVNLLLCCTKTITTDDQLTQRGAKYLKSFAGSVFPKDVYIVNVCNS